MDAKFNYNDIVMVSLTASERLRPGAKAWVVGVTAEDERRGAYYETFRPGNVYTIEFDDGASVDIHEDEIDYWTPPFS